jgi:hypothetical protein
MKLLLAGIGFSSLLLVATSAMADDLVSAQQAAAAGPVAAVSGNSDQGGTAWGSSDSGQPSVGLTRSDVKRQLVHSEQDGQIAQLNSTLYKGQ